MAFLFVALLGVAAYAHDEPRMTARQAQVWLGIPAAQIHEVPERGYEWPDEPHVRVECDGKPLDHGVAVYRCADEVLVTPGRLAVVASEPPGAPAERLYGPGWPRASGRTVERTGDWRRDIAWWCEDTSKRRTRRFIRRAGNVAEVAPVCVPREVL